MFISTTKFLPYSNTVDKHNWHFCPFLKDKEGNKRSQERFWVKVIFFWIVISVVVFWLYGKQYDVQKFTKLNFLSALESNKSKCLWCICVHMNTYAHTHTIIYLRLTCLMCTSLRNTIIEIRPCLSLIILAEATNPKELPWRALCFVKMAKIFRAPVFSS